MLSAHDVARELRRRLPDAGDVKIHKLACYCQGWHLAWTGEPMFREAVEAWTNGPVVADLWHDEKRARPRPPAEHLSDEQVAVVDYVVGRYGGSTGRELVRRTHLEDPGGVDFQQLSRTRESAVDPVSDRSMLLRGRVEIDESCRWLLWP